MKTYFEYVDNERCEITEQEVLVILKLDEMEWKEYLKSLPRKDYYGWSQQDEIEWKNAKPVRMDCVREEIRLRNEFADSLQNPILKRLVRVNEDEVCLELVDIDGSHASDILEYVNKYGREVK